MIPSPKVTHLMTLLVHMLIIAVCCILKTIVPQATLFFISKLLNLRMCLTSFERLKLKKETGFDNIPPKLVKYGAHILCNPINHLINKCIYANIFPDVLKCVERLPIFKKGDILDNKNYMSVIALPCMSKVLKYFN